MLQVFHRITFITLFSSAVVIYPLTYVFSHGILDSGARALAYSKCSLGELTFSGGWQCQPSDASYTRPGARDILRTPLITIQYPHDHDIPFENGALKKEWRKWNVISCAQSLEMEKLHAAITSIADNEIVLMGHSMGAATLLTYLSVYSDPRIKLVILEAPYDRIETAMDYKLGPFAWTEIGQYIGKKIFAAYDPQGITPITSISERARQYPPILCIHSKKDFIVPYVCSQRLCTALKQAGHAQVYFLTLEHAGHTHALVSADGDMYEQAVHACYKKYGLPHNDELAIKGDLLLQNSLF